MLDGNGLVTVFVTAWTVCSMAVRNVNCQDVVQCKGCTILRGWPGEIGFACTNQDWSDGNIPQCIGSPVPGNKTFHMWVMCGATISNECPMKLFLLDCLTKTGFFMLTTVSSLVKVQSQTHLWVKTVKKISREVGQNWIELVLLHWLCTQSCTV